MVHSDSLVDRALSELNEIVGRVGVEGQDVVPSPARLIGNL